MTHPSCTNDVPSSGVTADGLSTFSDGELALRSRDDPEAFAQLFERYYGKILNYAFHRTLDVDLAEELTAATFFKALRGLDGYADRGAFKAWLFRIATNEIRMNWRTSRNRQEHDREYRNQLGRVAFTDNPGQDHEDREQQLKQFARLHEALARLPDRYRTALVLRYIEGLSLDETAQAMGAKTGTVKSLVHRGLKRLRRIFETESATNRGTGHCKAYTKESI